MVDLQPLFFSMTLDTTTALLFGRSLYSLKASEKDGQQNLDFAENFDMAQDGLVKRFRIAPWQYFYNPKHFQEACTKVHDFVDSYISQKRSVTDSNDRSSSFDFFDQVAEESANPRDLRDQLLNVLLAGRDTTACCLSWTL